MKRFRAIAAVLLFACKEQPPETPQTVITTFLGAWLKGSAKDAHPLLSAQDRAARSVEDLERSSIAPKGPLADRLREKISFQILEVVEKGDTATVSVEITQPNVQALAGELLVAAMGGASKGEQEPSKPEIQKRVTERIMKGEIPLKKEQQVFRMRREDGKWRVFLDFETDASLLAKRQQYREKIEILDLRASMREKAAAVEFALKNGGPRIVTKIFVTVDFKDEAGKTIHQAEYRAVLPGESKPLAPGDTWRIEPGSYFSAAAIPPEWKEGAVTAKVTEVEFQ